ncbi:MAG: NAD-dependent epimerase/dehydratase family protein [Armatimonadetes bacterium]|nr:NAD-dependent epimerase/dehydratase family protein [Armatimonadota bacterium]MDW8028992.1 NAD-dependent epimerase/dehydratase family protein [Armatimonadota bacterium]
MKELRNCKVLVTGGNGFVGANIVRHLLSEGAKVHLILRPNSDRWRLSSILRKLTVHEGDITDHNFVLTVLESVQPNLVAHCAMFKGYPKNFAEERETFQVSVMGTLYLLQASVNVGVEKFVHFGSSTEYGPRPYPLTENASMRPAIFRGLAKGCAAMVCDYFARIHQLPVVNLRLFSVYGPWESPTRFIPTVLRHALWGGEIPLTAFDARHDFIFVGDVLEAFTRAVMTELRQGEVFNIGTGKQWSNSQVVKVVESLLGRTLPVSVGAHPSHPPDTNFWVAKIDKAKKLLGWQPKHELRDGLMLTMEWMKRNAKWYRL